MNLLRALKKLLLGQTPVQSMSKSMIMILVAQYDLDYIISDRKSGDQLTYLDLQDYDPSKHTIWIEDQDMWHREFGM